MITLLSFFLILPLSFQSENSSLCTEIINYENGLPASIKQAYKSDILAPIIITLHKLFMSSLKNWPDYYLYNCDTRLMKFGKHNFIKASYRPRGCCVHCCRINNVEDYLTLHLFKPNKLEILPLSTKKEVGKLKSIGFNSRLKTIFWLHGFTEDGYTSRTMKMLIDQYLKRKQHYNFIMLDYSELASVPWYFEAIDNIKLIAKAVAKFVMFYHKTGEFPIENIHMIGVSLGGHTGSQIAKEMAKFQKIPRLTILDPSFSIYPYGDDSESISKEDAKFVDVIYSTSNLFGYKVPTGHANFYVEYPTGVVSRPGCDLLKLLEMNDIPIYLMCDHLRAYMMYLETVTDPYLYPVCQNVSSSPTSNKKVCGYLGFAANKSTTFGKYYVTTKLNWTPWQFIDNNTIRNSRRLKIHNTSSQLIK